MRRRPAYVEANLSPSNLKNLGLNLMCICGVDGEVIVQRIFDLGTQETMDVPGFPKDRFPASHILVRHNDPTSAAGGLMLTGRGPLLVASRPILTDNREGPVRGALIMGRFLDAELIRRIQGMTKVALEVLPPTSAPSALETESHSPGSAVDVPVHIDDTRADVLTVSATLADLAGRSVLPIRAAIPRQITARGRTALRFAQGSVLVVGVLVLVGLMVLLQWAVLGPIMRLTRHAVRVGRTDDLTVRLAMRQRDEIGTLAAEFDRMVERLADARKRLLEQSYESGLAEMASGALHNVRNALTPVLAEMDLLRCELAKTPLDQIEAARAQLGDASVPDARRKDLARFLDLAGERLVAVTRETHARLDDVVVRARQVERFLEVPGAVGRASPPMEWVSIGELVSEAAALLSEGLRARFSIVTGPGLDGQGPIRTNRLCLLQVFANLLTNAAESIIESGKARGTVCVDVSEEESDGGASVHVRVSDDGAGIAPENLPRVFERGFSTKGERTRGVGLHWCANSVAAIGGRMYAESDGIGCGASLHIVLPRGS